MIEANADPREIDRFEDLAERWWDPEGALKSLHDINPLRLNYIEQEAGLAGRRVLDVGCGGGILAEGMAKRGAEVTGIDLAGNALAVAALHLKESGAEVTYVQSSAEDFAARHAGAFDVVTCLEMLEHVPDPASVVRACAALVKPGGDVFFSTLNRTPRAWLFAVVGAEYVLRLLPRGTHDYLRFIRPSELSAMGRAAGLEMISATGIHYGPLTRRYWLGPGLEVNYLCHARRLEP
ncbi:MAG: bifunctional 2-polyprenyl-6-hydroxyphenol methylase/3-demethylubiquinol 3-O-methyltransferase UbiG [Acidiferrobacteraceae bacterium]